MNDQPRCDWPMGTVWTRPQECGRPAKYKVTSGPLTLVVTHVCGIHENKNNRLGGASEVLFL